MSLVTEFSFMVFMCMVYSGNPKYFMMSDNSIKFRIRFSNFSTIFSVRNYPNSHYDFFVTFHVITILLFYPPESLRHCFNLETYILIWFKYNNRFAFVRLKWHWDSGGYCKIDAFNRARQKDGNNPQIIINNKDNRFIN